jgi:ferritin-like protein
VIIVLAVKAALLWKLNVIEDIAGGPRRLRDIPGVTAPAPQLENDSLTSLAKIILPAIYSEKCAQRMLCEICNWAPKEMPAVLR